MLVSFLVLMPNRNLWAIHAMEQITKNSGEYLLNVIRRFIKFITIQELSFFWIFLNCLCCNFCFGDCVKVLFLNIIVCVRVIAILISIIEQIVIKGVFSLI
jgi:hypothetical protein